MIIVIHNEEVGIYETGVSLLVYKKMYFCSIKFHTMRTFILNTINQIPATNRQLDYKSTLKTNEWIVFSDSEGDIEKFLFMDNDELLVSVNGKTSSSKWQFMKVNSSLIIDDGINKYMFKVVVCSKDIVFLNVDSTNSYSFLINTKSKALKDASLKDIKFFLMNNFNIDLFDDQEREFYNETQKEIERIKQEEENRKSQNVLKWFGLIVAIIICFGVVIRVIEHTEEKRQQKEEYEKNHPIMNVTRIENRQAVDLGLSVKWATCNIGANKPTEKGNNYGWGDTSGVIYTAWSSGRYGREYIAETDGDDVLFAYPTRKDRTVPISIIGTEYDVATQSWGSQWRMPTRAEAQELIDSCKFVLQGNSIDALGPNGNCISFPIPLSIGCCYEYATGELDTMPLLVTDTNNCIHSFRIGRELYTGVVIVEKGKAHRYCMLTLRAVCEK